ncbi:hypothetical protein EIK77_002433 [Talaromyces pinophilus]|nr:hypothetical protein EIK77_002433 [Talaromyces pinophilus]
MASNFPKRQDHPHAQVTTPSHRATHGCSPKHAEKHNQPIVERIRQLLCDMKGDPGLPSDSQTARSFEVQLDRLVRIARDEKSSDTADDASKLQLVATRTPPNTPCHDDSEPVTIGQLIELFESAVEAQGGAHVRSRMRSMGTLQVCYHTSLDDLTTHENAEICWNSPAMGDQSPGLTRLLHLVLQLLDGRAPCTEAEQRRADPVASETTLQVEVESSNRGSDSPNIKKSDTELGIQADMSQISNLKAFSRYPNAHPMVWNHLFEKGAVSQDRVESLGVRSSPASRTTQLPSSEKLHQECIPTPIASPVTDGGLDKQEQAHPVNDQSRSQLERASRLEVKRIRQV